MRLRNFFLLLLIVFLWGCPAEPDPPADYELKNPLFSKAENFIETGEPEFNSYTTPTPTFTWEVTGKKLVFLAVFDENIVVQNNRIVNTENNVWAWHSGLGTGRVGFIKFDNGCDVINGELQIGISPTPLISGRPYTWAVWAWDDDGEEITHSSQEMYFIIE